MRTNTINHLEKIEQILIGLYRSQFNLPTSDGEVRD